MTDKDAHIAVKDLTLAYGCYVVQQHLTFTINCGPSNRQPRPLRLLRLRLQSHRPSKGLIN